MRTVVYSVAASSGGALAVLRGAYEQAVADVGNEYLFVISTPQLESRPNVEVSRHPWVKSSWLHRLVFDMVRGPKLVRDFCPDSVVSLQNTTLPRVRTPQTVFFHNVTPRPISDVQFSAISDPGMWVRQNVIGALSLRSLRRAARIVVQAEWIAERLAARCGISRSLIEVRSPLDQLPAVMPAETLRGRPRPEGAGPVRFVYPASAASYKNHARLLEACELLKDSGETRWSLALTLSGDETKELAALASRANARGLPVDWLGWLEPEILELQYGATDVLVFPSLLETVGLPLVEAREHGLAIIASARDYAREATRGASQLGFFDPLVPASIAEAMRRAINQLGSVQ